MVLAIIGSRSIAMDLSKYVPSCVDEIVSGGATGIDEIATIYAKENKLKLTEFFLSIVSLKEMHL